jgi:hypothetical protein
VFNKFPKYDMKILLGDFNTEVGREDIFKRTTVNESLHEISNDNGVRLVNFATSKNLRVKMTMFPHCNIHKYLDASRCRNPQSDWPYSGESIRMYFMFERSGQQIRILTTI